MSNYINNTVDRVIEAVNSGKIYKKNISFNLVQRNYKRDIEGVWKTLDRGRMILNTYDQLDQYLYSYAPMIQKQWLHVLKNVSCNVSRFEIIDYGCGQGLGSLLFLDKFGVSCRGSVSHVTLIEPSKIALARANYLIKCCSYKANITLINKK